MRFPPKNQNQESSFNNFAGCTSKKTRRILLVSFCLLGFLSLAIGCSRQHYRVKADRETYSLLAAGGTQNPCWKLDDYCITPSNKSRMFDPYNPDCEPMPPDDPNAHRKMHCVAGMKGSKHWTDCGCTKCTENPKWKEYLLFNDRGAVSLDKNMAVDLALIHSPEYQSALENLFLSAMKVAQERFRFDIQFYGGDSLFYEANGKLRGNKSNLTNDADISTTKLMATGGEILVGIANSITWTFNGSNSWYADSLLNIGFIQPLLRGAGRKIVLEDLTQSERDLLAAIRQMVFFRQGFYTKTITGAGRVSAPSGSISSPSISGSGFYGLLASQVQIQNRRQNIVGLEGNLHRFIEFFNASLLDDVFQVEQTRQRLLNSESGLLSEINTYQTNIETYLRSLGLPPDLQVEINDPLMEQFQLSSPTLTSLQADLNKILGVVRQHDQPLPENLAEQIQDLLRRTESEIKILENDLIALDKYIPARIEGLRVLEAHLAERIKQGERIDPSIYDANLLISRIKKLKELDNPKNHLKMEAAKTLVRMPIQYDAENLRRKIANSDFETEVLDALRLLDLDSVFIWSDSTEETSEQELQDELKKTKETLTELQNLLGENPQLSPKSNDAAKDNSEQQVHDLAHDENIPNPSTQKTTAKDSETLAFLESLNLRSKNRDLYRDWIRHTLTALQNELNTLSIAQIRARLDAITLLPTKIKPDEAFQLASEYRLDWMNERAKLVDSWRKIDIAANKLKGDLKLNVQGEMGTIDQKGVHFDADNSRLKVGLEWDSPLTRYTEMLNYRRSQIFYQAARRNYYTYVDSVNADLRKILRDIQINQINFEIQRNAILIALVQVDVKQLELIRPPKRGEKLTPTSARDLIDALAGLLDSQNAFLSIWVQYETQRMLLDLNMGTMQLNEQGRWIDPGMISAEKIRERLSEKIAGLTPSMSRQTKMSSSKHHGNKPSFINNQVPPAPRLRSPKIAPPQMPLVLAPEESEFSQIDSSLEIPMKLTSLPINN
ncbi:MAG: hypothetical protein ACRCUY_01950 [Thermoguttaceae bacterium]